MKDESVSGGDAGGQPRASWASAAGSRPGAPGADSRAGALASGSGAAAPGPGIIDVLAGGGELGALMRAHDWSATPLGPVDAWPQSLKTAVRIMLTSRQPIWIGWGRELTYLYNDPYKSIIGGKHPWALGKPTSTVWEEIRGDIEPLLTKAMDGEEGTYVEEQLLIMERNGYPEETYYTFSYSPIPDDTGIPGGIICANTDDTQRVIGQRQLALLTRLGSATTDARTAAEAVSRAAQALCDDPRDIPFAAIYLADPGQPGFRLAAHCGGLDGHPAAPEVLPADDDGVWPIGRALAERRALVVDDLASRFAEPLPSGSWRQQPKQAVVLPIVPSAESASSGALVVGLNPFRLLDDSYGGFLTLATGQIAAAIASAEAFQHERRRAETLETIDRAKTAFFSNVSHEFRTPLTLMLGPLEELAARPDLRADDRERADVAQRNALRLLKLVNSLLDFSRIEAGRLRASFEPTDLAGLTAELASNFRSATERAGLSFAVDCAALAEPVYVDREMWEKVVLNLISNAFKFTFDGGIAVRLRGEPGAAVLEVTDTGTGIPAAELPRLFERFHRIEGARGRSFEGSGIGLALVQELVRLHGGSVAVDSEEGRGSTFAVRLPFGREHLPAEQVKARGDADRAGSRAQGYVEEALRWLPGSAIGEEMPEDEIDGGDLAVPSASGRATILLADDNADMRAYVARLLGARHDVTAVADGQAALDVLATAAPPDLVVTDIMMPRLDGFGLIAAIRAEPALADIPIIALSARAGEEARIEGMTAGVDDYLVKPFSARELTARVEAALQTSRLRRQVTAALRASEERFRTMADSAPVMIWTVDTTGFCTFLSRSWFEFTGQTPETGLGFGWLTATHPDDREMAERIFLTALGRRDSFALEYRLRRADGTYCWAVDSAAPWYGSDGAFLGYIGSVIDITERKAVEAAQQQLNEVLERRVAEAVAEREAAEAQLRQAQKMESIGKLTGGVAHDFNNLLQVIGGNLRLLQRDIAGNERAERRVANAITGVTRGAKLASQLLSFGRRQPLEPKAVNLGRLVRAQDEVLRRTLGEGIDIETIVSGGLWNTLVDPAQVENALINLAINARDAMEGHGKLTIEAGNSFLDEAYSMRNDTRPGQYVMLAVTDTGCGIPAEQRERVFEPFFTTKPEGQGTGLGLSMVYGFVKQSGGHVKIYSEVGQGTTIRLYLPRVRQAEDLPAVPQPEAMAGGTETVLVVEDDNDVRTTVVEMLGDLGYRVLKASDAQSAFAIIESGVGIDVLFTDVVMPGPMRSPELARKARERLPSLAVLFTSGYTDNAIVHAGRLDPGVELLSKPYTQEDLARKIRHVLGTPAAAAGPITPTPARADSASTPAGPASRRVLLVEDDSLIRMTTADMLADLGHAVFEAGSAEQALSLLEANDIEVLLVDVGLPGVSGIDLAMAARRRSPGLRVVFATGRAALPELGRPELAGASLLLKPYDEAGLAGALA